MTREKLEREYLIESIKIDMESLKGENDKLAAEVEKYKKAIEDIKAEIMEKAKEHTKYTDCGRRENGLYEALDIIDRHIADMRGEKWHTLYN